MVIGYCMSSFGNHQSLAAIDLKLKLETRSPLADCPIKMEGTEGTMGEFLLLGHNESFFFPPSQFALS